MASSVLTRLLEDPVPSLPAPTSPAAQIIAYTLSGITAIILAVATAGGFRRRKAAEALEQGGSAVVDLDLRDRVKALEERMDAYREHGLPDRLTKVEVRGDEQLRRIADLEERMDLRRAADIVIESEQAPRRRRRAAE